MAFIRRSVTAVICMLGIVGVIFAEDCDKKQLEQVNKCAQPFQGTLPIARCESLLNTAITCLKNVAGQDQCPELQKVTKSVMDFKTFCCEPLANLSTTCDDQKMQSQFANFKHTKAQCMFAQEFWTCTGPFRKELNSCSVENFQKAIKSNVEKIISQLDSCKDHGYNITVDYPGTGTTFKSHPLLAVIVPVVSTIILWLNKAY